MFTQLRSILTSSALMIGFLIILLVGFGNVQEKQQAFDLGFRFLRFGAAFAIFNV
jgi:hypothetical protein